MTFYAKPDQTYDEHLEAVYKAWKETIASKRPLIEKIAERYNFSVKRFLRGSLLTVAFHDVGKMTVSFQEMMDAIIHNKSFNKNRNYRHELVSFIYTTKYWYKLNQEACLTTVPLEAIAVAGHHKPLNTDLTAFIRESNSLPPRIIPEGINHAIAVAEELFHREGYTLPLIQQGNEYEDPFRSLTSLILNFLHKGIEKDGPQKCRVIYILLKGILHYADWYGSGRERVIYGINKDSSAVINDIKKRCNKKGIVFKGLRPFQEFCAKHSGDLIAVAPTGSGKTEASILWALKNAKELNGAKILYLLPTMVTANNIWSRLADTFGEENVGLTHSTANLFLQGDSSLEAEEDRWENRKNLLFNQSFIKPITVGTIDQLLTTGFNSGRWTLKEANAFNAVIIIDEIHAYDGWTLGILISTIRHFSSARARFMLMSATLPQSLQSLLSRVIKSDVVVKEETLLNAKRSKYFVIDDSIDNALEDIKQAVLNGKRVLVVVNTIKACQDLAQRLSDLNPVCYHSRFILNDRKAIEKRIDEARFVIATQVVEVSLDIDYDWLFTECAPPDAIAQRAGRVNRHRDLNRDSRVYIFKASEKAEKIYNPINDRELLSRSFDAFKAAPQELTENDLIEIVETVYKDYRIDNTEPFNDALKQYEISQKNRLMILDSRIKEEKQDVTRQVKYEAVPVIPECFREEVLKLKPHERQWYEVKLPLWYVRKHREEIKGITFCEVKYDSKIGATFVKDDQLQSVII
ncbi:MAG: CRISPR-associated helicase Cas3' [Nitrospirae bacterium]|nr:CRISPR-associated helicase Cas3' [Nitrospirota bacterium]